MDNNAFGNALARAQALMLDPNFNSLVESKAKGINGNDTSDLSDFEVQAFGTSYSNDYNNRQYNNNIQSLQNNRQQNRVPNLPKEIMESFQQQAPMSGNETSPMEKFLAQMPQREIVREQYAPQQNQGNIGISADLIKYVVKEAVEEALKSRGLNESNILQGLRVCKGNKIQFVDTKGNLFEGTLTLKKKA